MMISDLPLDLESEILSRVPAKSISQSLSTCKRWYALHKDPEFVKKKSDKTATQVIIKKNRRVYSVSINLHRIHNDFDPSFEFTGKLSPKDSEHVEISEIFHCNGLLLCTTKDYRLIICNPCTGRTRWIQTINRSRRNYSFHPKYVLGCENNNSSFGDYKILSFGAYLRRDQMVREIGIYEFNSDSWRFLDDVTSYDWHEWLNVDRGLVSLMGNTYCFCNRYEENRSANYMLMFDFTTEKLRRLSPPYQSDFRRVETVVLSVVREEKLALMRLDRNSYEAKIWVTNTKIDEGKDLSWSVFLVVNLGKFMNMILNI